MCKPRDDVRYVFDRREEGLCVLTGPEGELAVRALPDGARPGDTIVFSGGVPAVCEGERRARLDRSRALFDKLRRR